MLLVLPFWKHVMRLASFLHLHWVAFYITWIYILLYTFGIQVFDMFDVKKKGAIDFGDFVRSLSVFHPKASQEDKIDCKLDIQISNLDCRSSLITCYDPAVLMYNNWVFLAVSFRLYNLQNTGFIDRQEVRWWIFVNIFC